MRPLLLLLLLPALLSLAARAESLLRPDDVLALCGDSITEQRLYSAYVEDYLLMCQPVPGLRVVQLGWNGETAAGFLARMGTDLLPFQPTVLTLCYGMNDGGYLPVRRSAAEDYRRSLRGIIDAARLAGVRSVVVGGPGAVDPAAFHRPNVDAVAYNQTLGALGEIARNLSQADGLSFADVHTLMLQTMEKAKAAYGANYSLAGGDGVHPGPEGQLVIAQAFLQALGCDGEIATLTLDCGTQQATASPGHQILSFKDGVLEVESSRYPFLVPPEAAGVLKVLPFTADLNRFVLVVRGLGAPRARVTWGSQAKDFDAASLGRGINLAQEFPENPLSAPFRRVDALVRLQQAHEVFLVKDLLHHYAAYAEGFPGDAAKLEAIRTRALEEDRALFDAAAAAVQPVRHLLRIEAAAPAVAGN
ncbi:MAG: SGNH/GDSL hydrolase family protein [Verrucomicrobium sp.]|nr:SGNH/GDSL hydrolase family protein [Verrucomicrobium sp.]